MVVPAGHHGHTITVTYPYAYMHDVYRVTTCRPGRGISWRPPAYRLLITVCVALLHCHAQRRSRVTIGATEKLARAGRGRPCKNFPLIYANTLQNLAAVCHTAWMYVGGPHLGGQGGSLGIAVISDTLETRLSPRVNVNLIALGKTI